MARSSRIRSSLKRKMQIKSPKAWTLFFFLKGEYHLDAKEKLKEFIDAIGVIGEIEVLLYNTLVENGVPSADARIITVDTVVKMLTAFKGMM